MEKWNLDSWTYSCFGMSQQGFSNTRTDLLKKEQIMIWSFNRISLICSLALAITAVASQPVKAVCPGAATLALSFDQTCYKSGDTVTATLSMSGLSGCGAAGFQAFLSYDTSHLTWVSTTYTASPFGTPLLSGTPSGGNIDVAAGITPGSQSPSSADAVLVTFVFTAGGSDNCSLSNAFIFRNTGSNPPNPPTRLTDNNGVAFSPLTKSNAQTIAIDSTAPTITSCPSGAINLGCNPTLPTCNDAKGQVSFSDNCGTPTKN
jgi:hypothetical protein